MSRNSNSVSSTLLTSPIHIPFFFDGNTEKKEKVSNCLARKRSNLNLESPVQLDRINDSLEKLEISSSGCTVRCERKLLQLELTEVSQDIHDNSYFDATFSSLCKEKHLDMDENRDDLFLDECSSNEDYDTSPLAVLAKQHSKALSKSHITEEQKIASVNSTSKEKHDLSVPGKCKNESDDSCHSFVNLRIQDCQDQFSEKPRVKTETKLNVLRGEGSNFRHFDGIGVNSDDNSEDEKSAFSPLAVFANKHHKLRSSESDIPDESKCSMDLLFTNRERISSETETSKDRLHGSKVMRKNLPESESFCEEKLFSSGDKKKATMSLDKSSDEEDCAFSPLAALADKYQKGKGAAVNIPLAGPCLRRTPSDVTSASSPSEQKSSSMSALSSSISSNSNSEEINADVMESFCRCQSECDGSLHFKLSCCFKDRETKSSSALDCESLPPSYVTCSGPDNDNEVLMLSDAISKRVTVSRDSSHESLMENKCVSSLSDLAVYHLTRSASCNVKSDHDVRDKKFHSDIGISKSVPGRFVIPYLRPEGGLLCAPPEIQKNCEKTTDQIAEKEVSAEVMDSADDWIIDLSNAVRDPSSRVPCNFSNDRSPTNIINVVNTEVQEEPEKQTLAPCELDMSAMLKMKFSYTKRRCSSFGSVLCHQWRENTRPYIPPRKQYTGTVVRFNFSTGTTSSK